MKLEDHHIEQLLQAAINAATKTGEYIALKSRQNISVKKKSGGSTLASQVVTEVDLASQKLILEHLEFSFDQFDLGLLTEELEDDGSRFIKDYFWCIDPLDGTLWFTEGRPGYAISIALVSKKGEAIIGVVLDLTTNNLYSSIVGVGAWKNEKPWGLPKSATKLSVFCDPVLLNNQKYKSLLNALKYQYREVEFFVREGGSVMSAIWAAENNPALFIKLPKKELGGGCLWDYAATECILKEAGVQVSNIFGEDLELNRKDSTFLNEKGVMVVSDKKVLNQINELY